VKPIEVTGITRVKRIERLSICDIPEIRTELIAAVTYSNIFHFPETSHGMADIKRYRTKRHRMI